MDGPELPDAPLIPSGEVVWIGGDIDRVVVSLRFYGDDLDPERVTELLGCEPTQSYRKGDALRSKRCRRTAGTGSWRLEGPKDETGTLPEQIGRLLDSVSSDLLVWEDLTRFRPDVFCGLFLDAWNRGCSLPPELMQRLAERGLTLGLDIYGDAGGEIPSGPNTDDPDLSPSRLRP